MNNRPSDTPRTDAAALLPHSKALYYESCRLERELKTLTLALDPFTYESIEEYEELIRFKVNDAFKSGWMMARTRNSHIAALAGSIKTDPE